MDVCINTHIYIFLPILKHTIYSLTSFLSYNIKPHFILLNIIQDKVLMALWLSIIWKYYIF